MYRYNYDYQASVEEFLNFKWTLVIGKISLKDINSIQGSKSSKQHIDENRV